MTALRETLKNLLALQQIDRQIQLLKRKQVGLDTGAVAGAAAAAAKTNFDAVNTAYHKTATDLKDTELKLSGLETKLKTYTQKLYQGGVTNAKELGNIEKEIAALGRQRSDLDDRILELMDSVDTQKKAAQLAEAESKAAADAHGSVVANYRTQYEQAAAEIVTLTQQRTDAQALVGDPRLVKRYDDIRAKAGGIGIVQIVAQNCGGCSMTLPTAQVRLVKEAETDIQICENCSRMLAP